jgi:hypothetical protein
VLISKVSLEQLAPFGPMMTRVTCDALALSLRLANSKLFCYKAIFDYLVYILFLSKGSFIVEVEIAHLLANIGLVHALWMSHVPMTCQTLSNEASIYSVRVRSRGPLLVPARLDLIFA